MSLLLSHFYIVLKKLVQPFYRERYLSSLKYIQGDIYMNKITYDEIINRIGYFRTKSNLSLRETSTRLGYNPQFMKTIENKSIELKVKTLLDFCAVVDITPQDFFYLGEGYNKEDKNVLDLYNQLSADSKQTILDLMKKLK